MATADRSWLPWTCIDCEHGFRSRTRAKRFLTCPSCGSVQPGPQGVREMREELGRLKRRRRPGKDVPQRTVRL